MLLFVFVRACVCTSACMLMSICMCCVCMCVHVCVCMHVSVCVHMWQHVHTWTKGLLSCKKVHTLCYISLRSSPASKCFPIFKRQSNRNRAINNITCATKKTLTHTQVKSHTPITAHPPTCGLSWCRGDGVGVCVLRECACVQPGVEAHERHSPPALGAGGAAETCCWERGWGEALELGPPAVAA